MHTTVLLKTAVDMLDLTPSSIVIDCTFGGGGHSAEILTRLGKDGVLISIDADESAFLEKEPAPQQKFVVRNFREIGEVVREAGLYVEEAPTSTNTDHAAKLKLPAPTAILADLGWRTDQFEAGGKGFSFKYDEPLLMTFGTPKDAVFTASDIVNEWEEEHIADVIFGYGEERAARKIAHAIVIAREEAPITTSGELAALIEAEVGRFYRHTKIHPATKTFQALRIAVNDELGALKTLLQDGVALLAPGGRIAIISFHSLEDRIIKHTFRQFAQEGKGTVLTKKPITPGAEELHSNPRARSAKLRVFIKS